MSFRKAALAAGLLLVAAQSASAAEFFVGRWAIDPAGCQVYGDTAETAPLVATDTTIRWFVAHCTIGKMYKTAATAVHIQARCRNEIARLPAGLRALAPASRPYSADVNPALAEFEQEVREGLSHPQKKA